MVGRVARNREKMHINMWQENLKERDHSQEQEVDMRIILKWYERNRMVSLDWIHLLQEGGSLANSCEHGNEPAVSIKC
jgi:hypothetical protein